MPKRDNRTTREILDDLLERAGLVERPELTLVPALASDDPLRDRLTSAVDGLEPPSRTERPPSLTVVRGGRGGG